MKRICAVIVNYKTAAMTRDCVATLAPQLDPSVDRIVVTDNASGGDEYASLEREIAALGLGALVELIPLPDNRGFSAGNNAGIRSCEARLYLLTNSDTLFRPGAVEALLAGAEANPQAGLISPRLEWDDGEPQVSCFRFHRPPAEAIHSANSGPVTRLLKSFDIPIDPAEGPTFPPWTSFACVLVRKEVFDAVGLLDDGFFMYYEDEDLCLRARNAGFDIVNWPEARVVHLQGKSSRVDSDSQEKKRLPDYVYFARSRYYRKHFGIPGWIRANLYWVGGRVLSLLRQAILGTSRPVPRGESRGIWKSRPVK